LGRNHIERVKRGLHERIRNADGSIYHGDFGNLRELAQVKTSFLKLTKAYLLFGR